MPSEGKKAGDRARPGIPGQIRFVLVLGAAAFVLVALVTWAPEGAAGGNLCGAVGRVVAGTLLGWLGFSSFLLFGMLAFWGGAVLVGKKLDRPFVKALGIVLLTLTFAAFLSLTTSAAPYREGGLYGPGGLAGAGLAYRLLGIVGEIGAFIVVTVGVVAGALLATEWLLFAIARDVGAGIRWLFQELGRMLRPAVPALQAVGGAVAERTTAPLSPPAPEAEEPPGAKALRDAEDRKRREREKEERREARERKRREAEARAREEAERAAGEEDDPEEDLPLPKARPARRSPPRRAATRKKTAGGPYAFPPLELLDPVKPRDPRTQEAMIEENGRVLEETLAEFRVEAEVVDHRRGPVVTLYELDLAAGIKVNRIHSLAEDLAVALKAPSVRVVAPLPGKSTIGVEVPNPVRDDVRLQSLVTSDAFERNPGFLPVFLGTDVAGNPLIEDLTTMPHMLIAGATGSGKSVCINSVLTSLLLTRTPEQVRLILIDPKQVELAFFSKVPHLMTPVVTDLRKIQKVLSVLGWLVNQMEERYTLFHAMEVRNIHSYNELGPKKIRERRIEMGLPEEDEEGEDSGIPIHMPYIVMVVDELADLMMLAGKEIETLITRLAQKSRAVGIHIVLATQRPSTDVITGLIKANMPVRCSFQVASKIDSRVVLDQNGAEKLLGRGDMLYLPPRSSHLVRAQGTFVSDGEVKRVVGFLAERVEQKFDPELRDAQSGQVLKEDEKDPLYEEAVKIILSEQRGSASLLQRALGVGYTRGSRLMDQMHKEGLVGPFRGSKVREVLLTLDEYEELTRSREEATS